LFRKSSADRRVQRTQRALHEALIGLVREKDYDRIAVREILARAQVGRSTFYAHFNSKDELLCSGIEQILAKSGSRDSITSFSLPIFEHHDRHRRTGRMSRKGRALLHERLRKVIVERVQPDVQRAAQKRHGAPRVPADLLAQFVASTFVVVLDWWLDTRSPLSPAEVNGLFCFLTNPMLA
jgi:AcrR family transcriptional regulator